VSLFQCGRVRQCFTAGPGNGPNAEELNVDIDGESLLEGRTLFPAERVILSVHLVGERNLFPVVGGEEPDLRRKGAVRGRRGARRKDSHLGEHPRESSGRVCAS